MSHFVAWRVSKSQHYNQFGIAPGGRLNVSIRRAFIKASVAVVLMSGPLLTTSAFGQSPAPAQTNDRYQDGIVIWETPADDEVPFLLKFNINAELR